MSFDYSSFLNNEKPYRETDPEVLFQTLQITDPKVERLWGEQVDALRGWRQRESSDVLIQLNTGAGKTLVGLLIAQSVINKTSGHVVYLCSTNQLVKQTAEKAQLYGIGMTTYINGEFSDDAFGSGQAACATSYASLFNGFTTRRGRFKDYPLEALVFDDAHTAESIIRGSYSVSVPKRSQPARYDSIADLYSVIFEQLGKRTSFEALRRGELNDTFFAPQYATAAVYKDLTGLLQGFVNEVDDAKYAWQHISDSVDLCAVLISPAAIEISPPFIPIANHFTFAHATERIYLSATLDSSDAFIRTFGDRKLTTVSPSTNAGDGERLIIFPSAFKDKPNEDYASAKVLANDWKTLISVPTYKRAEVWSDFATLLNNDTNIDAELNAFRDANDTRKVAIVARYDGLDLPEDRCRMMIIDESPSGASILEHFLYERLGLVLRLQSTVASRIVQSFGRICRGIKDHGCFILTGSTLIQWLRRPANQDRLPKFLRRQLTSSLKLNETVADESKGKQLVQDFFARSPDGWLKVYEAVMKDWQQDPEAARVSGVLVAAARAEVRFASCLFDRNFPGAASAFGEVVDAVFAESSPNGAWIAYWLAYAYERAGNAELAKHFYGRAHGSTNGVLARPPMLAPVHEQFSLQLQNISNEFNLHQDAGKLSRLFAQMTRALEPLKNPQASPDEHAEAVRALGDYLGLLALRPERGQSGPDVHWYLPDAVSFGMELKTHKDRSPCYTKAELGQIDDHLRWAQERAPDASAYSCVFVGPPLPACKGTTPGTGFFSVELDRFAMLGDQLRQAIEPICASASPLEFMPKAYDAMKNAGLLYDDILQRLERTQIAVADHS